MPKRRYVTQVRGASRPAHELEDDQHRHAAPSRPADKTPEVERANGTSQRGALPNSAVQRLVRGQATDQRPPAELARMFNIANIEDAVKGVTAADLPKGAVASMSSIGEMLAKAVASMHLVMYGSRGLEVMMLQGQLNMVGASPALSIDGIFGPKTRRAVKAFQKGQGLAADGIVGNLTREALKKQSSLQATIDAIMTALGSVEALRAMLAGFGKKSPIAEAIEGALKGAG